MGTKHLAIFAALLSCAAPSAAFDGVPSGPTTLFYFEIPLDGKGRKENVPNFGFAVQGREYRAPTLHFDTRVLHALEAAGLGVEAKWVAGGAALLLLFANSSSSGGSGQPAAAQSPGGGGVVPQVETPQTPGGGGGGGGGGGTPGGGTPPPCCGVLCAC
jgi:hypothetical protein